MKYNVMNKYGEAKIFGSIWQAYEYAASLLESEGFYYMEGERQDGTIAWKRHSGRL